MTIGKQGDYQAFDQLKAMKEKMCLEHSIPEEEFELSMGMSGDF